MKKGTIILIATAAVAGLAYAGFAAVRKAQEWADKITVSIAGIGKPIIKSSIVSIPLKAAIFNAAPISIPVSNFVIKVLASTGKAWAVIASTQPSGAFTINSGNNFVEVVPQIDLNSIKNSIAPDGIWNEIKTIFNTGSLPTINLRIDAITTVGGVDIPVSKPYTLNLNNL